MMRSPFLPALELHEHLLLLLDQPLPRHVLQRQQHLFAQLQILLLHQHHFLQRNRPKENASLSEELRVEDHCRLAVQVCIV
jgi:hypothetical protein